ncbi:MAG: hypothetical protein ACD_13C00219G0012 [uncultured bacterium]|uniref:Uncharacterized protein n=1 Tax=Candidatus Woesebacteria bacterium GW2011_GWA1_40_43 TaxID=1618553 RepID=A0A0G0VLM0_9BACT|nr:MAG: hypothetical protein ACD_13C00219G0012 [uncultured bacterium]KKR51913.1 MAG: hypothetical protein UT88_C0026G0004 [Candidatus Woesebacteria bacterium GW2011_GWD2_40_19]KKR57777.1 MAG: hypothetical protein UT96_C0014G0010 [Candidatus Woesebacteria bacterium GW2011_GWC2_40_30]KKR63687.1 MAG: hypothetical protein UU02_C0021G0003 [Candidatus Woesebacteria bacterium GW2011_GWA1_40_43]HAU65490.1 hypothetical protein [Candidatus Woesebacteria bacterium]
MDDQKEKNQKNAQQVNLNLDSTPILYTDNVLMTTNSDGVVLDIAQRVGSTNQVRIVSRVGMSREHAKKLVNELGKLLAMTDGKIQTGKDNLN